LPQRTPSDLKQALRVRLRALRRRLAAREPGAAEQAARALPMDRLPSFTVAAGYHPIGGEMDPGPLLRRLTTAGVQMTLPAATEVGAPLEFRAPIPTEPLRPDALGVLAPSAAAPALRPDLVIAPVLGFDRGGGRLGQGGGCYDRTLAMLRSSGPVFVIGLAFAGQELARVPVETHDQSLDAILTETGYIETRKDH
jgi:5-formyltetrahydrofolate cyclo-ligase